MYVRTYVTGNDYDMYVSNKLTKYATYKSHEFIS